ncbi:gliding motility lipoprotein GldH [Algoriphagus sp.]|uniref:gliding motility lipoprotein GldH n=1 Tax=Algoriphagus sp. TaxID=1872435 RepID=UPI00391D4F69
MNKWGGIIGLALLCFGVSCSADRVFEEFHSFNNLPWYENDSVSFDLKELKVKNGKNLIAVRFTEAYPFSNFYLRVMSQDSLGVIIDNRLINVPLFDSKSGQPRGKGFGNTFTYYDTLPFQMLENTNKLVFLHYMRQDQLPGIDAIGLKIVE